MSDETKTGGAAGTDQTVSQAAEQLTRSMTDLVGAVFGVGAAVAKTAAEATAGGRPVLEPKTPQGPLSLIIHYGLTTAANLVRTVVTTTSPGQAAGTAARSAAPPSVSADTPTGPTVTLGATLRVPLSIENPSADPMESLEFKCLRVEALQVGQGQKLGVANVRLSPAVLSIAPRDFEKLTVFIDTTVLTALGVYRAVIGVGAATMETAVEFQVVEASR